MSKQNQNTLLDIRKQLMEACKIKKNIAAIRKVFDDCKKDGVNPVDFIGAKDQNSFTPFLYACALNNIKAVKFFIEQYKGAGRNVAELINSKDDCSNTPFLAACYHNNKELVNLLINEFEGTGGNIAELINSKDSSGDTPLLLACRYNNTELVELFITKSGNNAGKLINSKDSIGNTPLLLTCLHLENMKVIRLLIEKYIAANGDSACLINAINKAGESPLLLVLRRAENIEIVKYLLDRGGNLAILPKKLFTDGLVADTLLKLIKSDSGFDYKNYHTSDGNTIFDCIRSYGPKEIQSLLETQEAGEHLADPEVDESDLEISGDSEDNEDNS